MIVANGINWQPVAAMPEDRKDGRRVLLWSYAPWIGRWSADGNGRWLADVVEITGIRYWADINPPE